MGPPVPSLVPRPSSDGGALGGEEGLGNNPGRKCPEGRNSATGVDCEHNYKV